MPVRCWWVTTSASGGGKVVTLRDSGNLEPNWDSGTETVPAIEFRGRVVSSSLVRSLIGCGNVSLAARMLTRFYALAGDIVSGHGIGRKVTVPTLNLKTSAEVLPGLGVYVTQTSDLDSGSQWPSVTNIGFRPTFAGQELTIETFLLRPPGNDPPTRINVQFLHRLREERKFDNPAALKAQILTDVRRAEAYFRRWEKWVKAGRRCRLP